MALNGKKKVTGIFFAAKKMPVTFLFKEGCRLGFVPGGLKPPEAEKAAGIFFPSEKDSSPLFRATRLVYARGPAMASSYESTPVDADGTIEVSQPPPEATPTVMPILWALSLSHFLNDLIQSLIPAIYPVLKSSFHLDYAQIGLITLVNQCTASIFQPIVGYYTDRFPKPFSLVIGMGSSLIGLVLLAAAHRFEMILIAVGFVGLGSSVFHPEASRVARLASGGKHGLAQSLFQVGGNAGTSVGPLLAALVIVPYGQEEVRWFALVALLGMFVLYRVGGWYKGHLTLLRSRPKSAAVGNGLTRGRVMFALFILVVLVFSKYIYLTSMTNYYQFYLMHKFHVTEQHAMFFLALFLFAVAAGTIIGGPIGDRIGRKRVIWASILGMAPFSLILPHVGIVGVAILSVVIGIIMASAFSAIVVYAQELVPGNVGMIAGLFFGLAFGLAGIGSALLGRLADWQGVDFVFQVCAFLPLLGLLTALLPDLEGSKA